MSTYPADAACAWSPVDFYPTPDYPGHDPYTAARAICDTCPVRDACLTGALERREAYGMWGGTTPADRDQMLHQADRAVRRERRAAARRGETRMGRPTGTAGPINHGTHGGYTAHLKRNTPVCDSCRQAERAYRRGLTAARNADRQEAAS